MSLRFRRRCALSILLTLLMLVTACAPASSAASISKAESAEPELTRFQSSFFGVFDTLTTVLGFAKNQAEFDGYVKAIKDELTRYHELFTIYDTYDGVNNIKTINENAGIAPVKVDPEIIELLKQCLWANEISGGQTNVAFGAVLSIWHDYRTRGIDDPAEAKLPERAALLDANLHTDIATIKIDEENSTVYLADSRMRLDVGSGSKGFATERVAKMIEEKGLKYGVISVGGNIRAIGTRGPSGDPWRIGIQNPDKTAEKQTLDVLRIDNLAVVTSGVYERFYLVDNVRYHHIIDPLTLFPEYRFDAVTVVTASAAVADALTTALFNMSLEDGKAMLENVGGCEALWVKGEERWSTAGYQAYVVPAA